MRNIVIFVPTYNEAETIGKILKSVPGEILGREVKLVVSDDHSDDETVKIATDHTKYVLTSDRNSGVGVSTKRGLKFITSVLRATDYVIKFDGDGQHDLSLLPKVLGELMNGAELVICSRFHLLSNKEDTPMDRILLNATFSQIVRTITGWTLTDVRSGYMGMTFSWAKHLAERLIVPGYGIPMEIILRYWAAAPNANVVEIPHPALYGPGISEKLTRKYSSEALTAQASRLETAYQALLMVVEDLKIPREIILKINGMSG